jgi:aminoglycoside/choline kinase family phosphotransferase
MVLKHAFETILPNLKFMCIVITTANLMVTEINNPGVLDFQDAAYNHLP